ncbi:hypothetical protein NW766_006899 [Fusarium irregulare]|uniref:Uncharacterized protein n=1 Tax=Fusarium irregulare TaxID=2494466 RepID=A0A9W8PPB1_9HYPO|nr:hypothetical protein NW766_006899 [Fusarium irregulare]
MSVVAEDITPSMARKRSAPSDGKDARKASLARIEELESKLARYERDGYDGLPSTLPPRASDWPKKGIYPPPTIVSFFSTRPSSQQIKIWELHSPVY